MRMRGEERHVWRVSGTAIERMVIQTDWDNDEATEWFKHTVRIDEGDWTDATERLAEI